MFFFFKQKTAYEIKECDWSSDVCSSDLLISGTIEKVDCAKERTGFYNLGNTYLTKGVDLPAPINEPDSWWIGHVVYVYEFGNEKDHLNINQIGRASCRERV